MPRSARLWRRSLLYPAAAQEPAATSRTAQRDAAAPLSTFRGGRALGGWRHLGFDVRVRGTAALGGRPTAQP
jgi:hypothetical protein